MRTPPQFFKWQIRVQDACVIEIAIAPAVQDVTDIQPAHSPGEICIADDIDRTAVAEQVVKLGMVRELIDPFQIDQEKPARNFGRCPEAIKKDVSFR